MKHKKHRHAFKGTGKLDFTDFTSVPHKLRKLIDSGEMTGALTFYKLKPTGDRPRIGMLTGGMKIEEVFDTICTIRRSMMDTMGFLDLADPSMMEAVQRDAVARQTEALIQKTISDDKRSPVETDLQDKEFEQ